MTCCVSFVSPDAVRESRMMGSSYDPGGSRTRDLRIKSPLGDPNEHRHTGAIADARSPLEPEAHPKTDGPATAPCHFCVTPAHNADTERPPSKRCARCRIEKPVTEFHTRMQDGKRYWQSHCRDCGVIADRERRQLPHRKAAIAARDRKRYAVEPHKIIARNAVNYGIKAGRITRQPCYAAGPACRGPAEAPHEDYSRPLDVVWTCRIHHRALHREKDSA